MKMKPFQEPAMRDAANIPATRCSKALARLQAGWRRFEAMLAETVRLTAEAMQGMDASRRMRPIPIRVERRDPRR
jgi:hypothetical protein